MIMKLVYANVGLLLAVAVMILGAPITALAQGVSYPMQAYAFTAVAGQVGDASGNGDRRYCLDPACFLRAGLSLPSGVTVTSIALDGCFFLDFPAGSIRAALTRYDRTEQQVGVTVQQVVSFAHDIGPGCARVFSSNNPPEINSPETIDNDNNYYVVDVLIAGDGTNSIRLKGIQVNYQ
jgi:hypothetical protein